MAAIEVTRGRAENEVDAALDVAVREVMAPAIDQDRVLPSEEAAAAEFQPVAVSAQREGLRDGGTFRARTRFAGIVGDGEVFPGRMPSPSICSVGVRNVPIGLPSGPGRLACWL